MTIARGLYYTEVDAAAQVIQGLSRSFGVLSEMVDTIVATYVQGRTVYAFGNGGSAAEADHFAAELLGTCRDRGRFPLLAVSLSSQPASLTAIANDYGYASYLTRAMEALHPEDTLLLLTTSGQSKNIVDALAHAYESPDDYPKLMVITGESFLESPAAAYVSERVPVFVVGSKDVCRVQEGTLFALHALVLLIEHRIEEASRGRGSESS